MAIKPWEQQEGEGPNSFEQFQTFLTMDRLERNGRAAYFKWHQREPEHKRDMPPGSWYDNMKKWRWEERALAYDREEDRKLLAGLQRRKLKSLVECADLGETLRKKAATAARMLTAVTQSLGQHDGKEVMVMAVNLTPDQIVRMAEVGVKIEQLVLGNPTENIAPVESPTQAGLESARDTLKKKLDDIRKRREEAEG